MHTPGPRPLQSVSAVQATQAFEGEQTGLLSGQSLLATHSTQAPDRAQAGVLGFTVMQRFAPTAQLTQEPASEQRGVVEVGEQSLSFAHWTHAPLLPQKGFAPPFNPAHAPSPPASMHD